MLKYEWMYFQFEFGYDKFCFTLIKSVINEIQITSFLVVSYYFLISNWCRNCPNLELIVLFRNEIVRGAEFNLILVIESAIRESNLINYFEHGRQLFHI